MAKNIISIRVWYYLPIYTHKFFIKHQQKKQELKSLTMYNKIKKKCGKFSNHHKRHIIVCDYVVYSVGFIFIYLFCSFFLTYAITVRELFYFVFIIPGDLSSVEISNFCWTHLKGKKLYDRETVHMLYLIWYFLYCFLFWYISIGDIM